MLKKIGMWVASVAAAVVIGTSFSAVPAKADEINLIGLTDDLVRLYISSNNELDVIGSSFAVTDEDFEILQVDSTHTILLNQFAYVNITGDANVRSGPGTGYDIVGRLFGGAIATAVDTEGEWTKITSGNVSGYVKTSFLLFGQDAVNKAEAKIKSYCRVTSNTLRLRKDASTNSAILHVLPAYAELKILDTVSNGSWYKVSYTDVAGQSWTGYVSTEYVTKGYYYAIDAKRLAEISSTSLMANAVWPFPGEYNLWSDYGYRIHPIYKDYRFHKGLDLGGVNGAPLVSILDGVVIKATWDSSSGNYVEIQYQDGFVAKYLHCSKLYVKTGQSVKAGQTIAACGSTGDATGPHLHFAMYLNGSLIDPFDYLSSYLWAIKWHCAKGK